MLSDEILERITERLAKNMEEANEYIISKIAETIKKIGTLTPTEATEMIQIFKYGGDYEKMVKKLSDMTKLTQKQIKQIFQEVAKRDYKFAKQFYDYREIKYIPWEQNIALQNQVNAISSIIEKNIGDLTSKKVLGIGIVNDRTGSITYKTLKEGYYKIVDNAILNISQGKETFNDVMYKQIQELGQEGLKVIYPTTYVDKKGKIRHYTRRLDSALRMNIQDGIRTLHNELQAKFGEEYGSDGVEITVHGNPAPDHAEVQGRQFSNKEFEKFQTDKKAVDYTGKVFPPEHEGRDRRSISEYNCYHTTMNIVLGVSKPQYTDKQLQEIIEKSNQGFELDGKHYTTYEGTQLQRRIETEIRKQKEFQIASIKSGNEKGILKAQKKIDQLNTKYKQLNQASGLKSKQNRLRVTNYKRTKIK